MVAGEAVFSLDEHRRLEWCGEQPSYVPHRYCVRKMRRDIETLSSAICSSPEKSKDSREIKQGKKLVTCH